MTRQVINVGRWVIDFCFADPHLDDEAVLGCLYDIDAPTYTLVRANRVMDSGRPNRGFTFVNPDLRRAVVMIGPTSSGRWFRKALVCELRRVSEAIARSVGRDLYAGTNTGLYGDLAERLIEAICDLGCDRMGKAPRHISRHDRAHP